MKKRIILTLTFVSVAGWLIAQGNFVVPEVTPEQKQEVLYNHVIAYSTTGISFAKSQGVTPAEYGKFIGKNFLPFWNPEGGLNVFANGMMFILAGMHPDNGLQIVKQSDKMIVFQLKNVDMPFRQGPQYGVTLKEFLDFSSSLISVLANHMNVSFSDEMTSDGWYKVTMKSK